MSVYPQTPCVVIDAAIMERNIEAMGESARKAGVKLRPHAKTHKMPAVARKQLAAGAAGITVAKVSEAEVMAEHGITDIFIAYPLVTVDKIGRALALAKRIRLIVGVDSREGALRLAEAATSAGTTLEVRLEIDTGLRRTGVPYGDAVDLAAMVHETAGLRLRSWRAA
ncbi:MAG: putative amino acid aldolase or racemase [Paenibacillus sp.]|nr:putative amino acid aldolase or racemase [Paenibacillus sp.]